MIDVTTESAQQMVDAGKEQLAEIQGHIDALDQQITDTQQELDALHQAQAERAESLHSAQVAVQLATDAHEQATSYAKLAHGTVHEVSSIQDTASKKKALEAAKKSLTQLEKEQRPLDQAATVRIAELDRSIHLMQSEKETRQAELQAVQRSYDRAASELGEAQYQALVANYQAQQKRVDDLLGQLVAAQTDAQICYEQGLQELAEWPELANAFAHIRPIEDATTQMLQATIAYVETALREVGSLPANLPPDLVRRGFTLLPLIAVPADSIYRVARYPQELQAHQARLHLLLSEYRKHLAEG